MKEELFEKEYYARYLSSDGSWEKALKKRAFFYKMLIKELKKAVPEPKKVLETGCGLGFLSRFVASMPCGPSVTATDISEFALQTVKEKLKGLGNVQTLMVDASDGLPFDDGRFDVVLAFDIIEHLRNPESFISECGRVLEKGGVLFLSTPNPGSLGARLKGRRPELKGRPAEERAMEWFGYRDDTHINIKTIHEWRGCLANGGFDIEKDGTDFWWDTPYSGKIPLMAQKVFFNGAHRLLTRVFGFISWNYGENYYAVCRKR